ncbi:hypothetical protein JCM10213_004799 [Rhodosporidiobolus nylandii]
MPVQPKQSTSEMPYQHQPKRRARRRAPLAAIVLFACMNLASSARASPSSSSPIATTPARPTWALEGVDSWGVAAHGVREDVGKRHLQARAEASEDDGAATSSTKSKAAATTTAVVKSHASAAGSAGSKTAVSLPASVATTATGDLAVASTSNAASATRTATSAVSTSTAVPETYQLPEAFDSTLGTNFTSTACPSFFSTFLADSTFTSCAPFSLLLTTSSAFFTAERSPYSLLPYVLDASCAADAVTCTDLMDSLAKEIKQSNTCGPDLNLGNPLAIEALRGFQNYRIYREAGCQKSNATGTPYCFAEAAAQSEPDDLYLYYVAEGTSLPSGTAPQCGSCAQGLFSIYSRYASNSTLAISKTYSSARAALAVNCGPTFAPVVTVATSSSTRSVPSFATLVPLLPAAIFALALAAQ